MQTVTSDAARLALNNLVIGQLVAVTYGGKGNALYQFQGPLGTEADAANWKLAGPVTMVKQVTTSRLNLTDQTADPDLAFDIEAGKTVDFEIRASAANEGPHINFAISVLYNASATLLDLMGWSTWADHNLSIQDWKPAPGLTAFGYTIQSAQSTSSDPKYILLGSMTTIDAGTFSVGWSQHTADGYFHASLNRGSRMRLWIY
jgi:hypothetical protein